jgi:hypothetical protein
MKNRHEQEQFCAWCGQIDQTPLRVEIKNGKCIRGETRTSKETAASDSSTQRRTGRATTKNPAVMKNSTCAWAEMATIELEERGGGISTRKATCG